MALADVGRAEFKLLEVFDRVLLASAELVDLLAVLVARKLRFGDRGRTVPFYFWLTEASARIFFRALIFIVVIHYFN